MNERATLGDVRRALSACLLCICGLTTAGFAQEGRADAPTPVIRTSTNLVVLDVVVTDNAGNAVRGLRQDQLHVLENGHEQSLKVFEEHDNYGLPRTAPHSMATVASHASNDGQAISNSALSVVLLDALNTANSDMSFARAQLQKVIAGLPAGSRIAIFVLANKLHMIQGFTTDTSELSRALAGESTPGGPWFNDPDTVLLASGGRGVDGAALANGTATPNTGSAPRTYLRDHAEEDEVILNTELRLNKTFTAIYSLINYLSVLPGKKNLVWIAGSFPIDFSARQLAAPMQAAHIAVYPVDARGLVNVDMFGAAGEGPPSPGAINSFAVAQLTQHQMMDEIARQTGGHAFYNNNDVSGAINESLNEGNNYYTLAYSPADKNWNGKYRKIEITTERRDSKLYYRRGYYAVDPAKNDASPPKFSSAMLHGAPQPEEIGISVDAKPTGQTVTDKDRKKQPDNKTPFNFHVAGTAYVFDIAITVTAANLGFEIAPDGKHTPALAFTLLVYDADGKILNAETGEFVIGLTDTQYQAVLKNGLTVNRKMEVPAGQVFLRAGVHDMQKELVGATEMPIVFNK